VRALERRRDRRVVDDGDGDAGRDERARHRLAWPLGARLGHDHGEPALELLRGVEQQRDDDARKARRQDDGAVADEGRAELANLGARARRVLLKVVPPVDQDPTARLEL
jgi:hypothetical protein